MASLLACSTSTATSGAGCGGNGITAGAGTTGRTGLILGTLAFLDAGGLARNVWLAFFRLDLVARTRVLVLGFRLNGLTLRFVDTCRVYANRAELSKAQPRRSGGDAAPTIRCLMSLPDRNR